MSTELYFAQKKAKDLLSDLEVAERNWSSTVDGRGLSNLWRISYAAAYGMDPDTWTNATQSLEFVGPDANFCRFRINLTRSFIKQRNQMAVGERTSFAATAVNSDVASLAQVAVAGRAIDYVCREAGLESSVFAAAASDGYYGEGLVWARFDHQAGEMVDAEDQATDPETGEPLTWPDEQTGEPQPVMVKTKKRSGSPKLRTLYPWQAVRDSLAEDPSWIIVKEPISKYELAAEYPEHKDAILGLSNVTSTACDAAMFGWDYGSTTTDQVIVRHFYHRDCKAVPGGRYLGYIGTSILWDLPCPVAQGLPVVSICTARYVGTSMGYPEATDLLGIQNMIDELWSQSATNVLKFGNQSLFGPDGVDWDKDSIARGGSYFGLKAGEEPPKAISWAQMPSVTQFMLEELPKLMTQITGQNSVSRGQPDANIKSGTFGALMLSIAERYVSDAQRECDVAINKLGNLILELVRANCSNGFAAEVAGVANSSYLEYFKSADLQGIKRVQITRQNPLMNNIVGRSEILAATIQLPKDARKEAIEMLLTGSLDAYTESDQSTAVLIRKENERLLKGEQVPVAASDDVKLHCKSHKTQYDKLRTQDEPEDPQELQAWTTSLQAFQHHLSEHAMTWANSDAVFNEALGLPPKPQIPSTGPAQPSAAAPPQEGDKPPAEGGDVPDLKTQPDLPGLPEPAQPPPGTNIPN